MLTVDGLPLHPLVVHAVVVLLPLAALCSLLVALRPAWRRRYGTPVALLTVAAVSTVPIATYTGEQLETRLSERGVVNPLISEHADRGEMLLPFAITFGVVVLALVIAGRYTERHARWRLVTAISAVLVVLAAGTVVGMVIWIGHAGTAAVWGGVV